MGGRRSFLRLSAGLPLGLASFLESGCGDGSSVPGGPDVVDPGRFATGPPDQPVLVPKVNGAVNVHPLRCLGCAPTDSTIDPGLVALQLAAAYELGFDGIRITAPFGDRYSLLAAIPYARAARALGIDALVLLADFSGLTLARALHDARRRPAILQVYAALFAPAPLPLAPDPGGLGPRGTGRIAFQILNEPVGFVGLPPEAYVHELLAPCYSELKRIDPGIIVVGAAEAGNLHGPPRMRAMLEAGLESVCDRIAYHVYSREIVPMLSDHVRRVVWVTESGARGTARHLPWVREVFPEILAQVRETLRIFYFDLFDLERGGYRVIDIEPAGGGAYRALVESGALHEYWSARVALAAGGRPLVPFATLVPDIRAYFPTAADLELLDGVAAR
jgi:hypothetical protein